MSSMLHAHGRGAMALALGATLVLWLAAPAATATAAQPLLVGPIAVSDVTPECPGDADEAFTGNGTGYLARVGRVDVTISHCAWVDWATGTAVIGDGNVTLVAADGDVLELFYTGTVALTAYPNAPRSRVDLSWEVTGGTGRFADATGAGHASGTAAYMASTLILVWQGTFAY